jgi:hypothetical protein
MSRLYEYLRTQPYEVIQELMDWLNSMPPDLQALMHRYPPRMKIIGKNSSCAWIVGYTETSAPGHVHLLVAPCDPGVDREHYMRATEKAVELCPDDVTPIKPWELN